MYQLDLRLLQTPFDFSQAFDRALKDIVVALPNRPAKEAHEDAVCTISTTSYDPF